MSHVISRVVFNFAELSDSAKEKAREWMRDDGGDAFDFAAETVLEDAARVGELMGIDINQEPVPLMGGGTRYDPSVNFDIYRNKVSIKAHYEYRKGAFKAVKGYAPQDTELQRIARELQKAQMPHFYKLTASCSHGGRYGVNTHVDVEHSEDTYRELGESEDGIKEALNDFAHWILKQLTAEYEYVYSDESIDEAIRANEYAFYEDGHIS